MYTPLLSQTGGSSKPLMDGTIVYFVLTLLGIVIVFGLTGSGKIPKNDMGMHVIFVIITGVCVWSVWAMTWLHQWHPLLIPTHGE